MDRFIPVIDPILYIVCLEFYCHPASKIPISTLSIEHKCTLDSHQHPLHRGHMYLHSAVSHLLPNGIIKLIYWSLEASTAIHWSPTQHQLCIMSTGLPGLSVWTNPCGLFTTRLCIMSGNKKGNHNYFWAPSQYKDRLIYVWRFPC